MQNYNLQDITKIINAEYIGNENLFFNKVIIDSRNIINSKNVLFVAIIGKNNNGHKYIKDVYNQGVRAFVVSENIKLEQYPEAAFIKVENTLTALQQIMTYKRSLFDIPIIAITGSNGKTIVKEWLSYLLEHEFRITKNPKSYNSQVGVPLAISNLDENTEIGIFEAGISQPEEMENLEKIIQPTIGVLTNIGDAHQANFFNIEEKIKEKIKLFKNCKIIIYCSDNKLVDKIIKESYPDKKLISWSENNNATINKTSLSITDNSHYSTINFNNKIFDSYSLDTNFSDTSSIYNILTCYTTIYAIDKYIKKLDFSFLTKFKTLPQIEMRLETLDGIQNSLLINDSYNSDINSIEIAFDYLNWQNSGERKTMVILSDIQQYSKQNINAIIKELIENKRINYFIGIGNLLFNDKNIFPNNSKFYLSTDDFLKNINKINFSNKTILIKGARNFQFEKIVKKLQGQNHETILEINLTQIKQNFDFFKSYLKPNTKIIGMVKAFAYGNGFYEISKLLQYNRIDYLAVAIIDEGEQLRKRGIIAPIIIMNPAIHYLKIMINNKLEPVIYSINLLKELIQELEFTAITKFPIHVKIDTGMHRLGFSENEIEEFCEIVNSSDKIEIVSVFSHLVATDNPDLDYFTYEQISRFEKNYTLICKKTKFKPARHILNSAGIIRFPEYQFEMVRIGIGLYGFMPEITNDIFPVATLKSIISQIHEVEASETISYNRSGKINKKTLIATIPIGYADGFNRKLGNGNWNFIVNGKKCPTIGNICMDMCMIDVSNISANEGDEVIIFGQENSVCKMAKILETIPYEIITSISYRIKRIYLEE